ncbi:uncharacterized protein AAEQ78_015404 [Lycaon pictus]
MSDCCLLSSFSLLDTHEVITFFTRGVGENEEKHQAPDGNDRAQGRRWHPNTGLSEGGSPAAPGSAAHTERTFIPSPLQECCTRSGGRPAAYKPSSSSGCLRRGQKQTATKFQSSHFARVWTESRGRSVNLHILGTPPPLALSLFPPSWSSQPGHWRRDASLDRVSHNKDGDRAPFAHSRHPRLRSVSLVTPLASPAPSRGPASLATGLISRPLVFATVAAEVTAVGCQLIYCRGGNGTLKQPRGGDAAGRARGGAVAPGVRPPGIGAPRVVRAVRPRLLVFGGAPAGGGADSIAA